MKRRWANQARIGGARKREKGRWGRRDGKGRVDRIGRRGRREGETKKRTNGKKRAKAVARAK